MADLTVIRTALASQITAQTGLRCEPQPRDQVSPPMAVILPHSTPRSLGRSMSTRDLFIVYGETMGDGLGNGAVTVNLDVMIIISDAAPVEKTQRALDAYLGIGPSETQSVPQAIMADTTLGGTVDWCMPLGVGSYGRIMYGATEYFGARMAVEASSF